jgi:hypothetical protein
MRIEAFEEVHQLLPARGTLLRGRTGGSGWPEAELPGTVASPSRVSVNILVSKSVDDI